jgi:DNA topoisomerase-1
MVQKDGRFGPFLACTGYPECTHTESVMSDNSSRDMGMGCPESGCTGRIIEKRSKRGKIFYGCSQYPECKFATWDKPVDKPCPQCDAGFLVEKETKRDGRFLKCITSGCGYKERL